MNHSSHLQKIRIAMAAAALSAGLAARVDATQVGINFRYDYVSYGVSYVGVDVDTSASGDVLGIPAANWYNAVPATVYINPPPFVSVGETVTAPGISGITMDVTADRGDLSWDWSTEAPYTGYLLSEGNAGYSVTLHGMSGLLSSGGYYRIQAGQSSGSGATGFANIKIYQGPDASGPLLNTLTNPTTGSGGSLSGLTYWSGYLDSDVITIVGDLPTSTLRSTLAALIIKTATTPDHFTDEGNITIPTVNLAAGKTSHFRVGTKPDSVNVTGTNGLSVAGTHTIDIGASGAIAIGTYTLIDYDGTIGGDGFAGFTLGTLPARMQATLVNNTVDTKIELVVTAWEAITWDGDVDGNWDTTTDNWLTYDSLLNTVYIQSDYVVFENFETNMGPVNLAAPMSPASVLFTHSTRDYTLTGDAITGPVVFTKEGTGTLNLHNNNAITGPIKITAGTVNLGNGGTSGSLGSGPIQNDSVLTWNRTDDVTMENAISGSGTFLKNGSGTLTQTGASRSFGMTTVNSGTLEVLNRVGDCPYEVKSNTTLKVGYSTGGAYANTGIIIHGDGVNATSGLYLKAGTGYNCSGVVQLVDAPTTIRTYGTGTADMGTFDINGNGLQVATLASGSVIDSNIRIVNFGYGMSVKVDSGVHNSTGDLIINGPFANTGGFYKRGDGSVLLNGVAESTNAGVIIQAGALITGVDEAFGANSNLVVNAGTTLDLNGHSQSAKTTSLNGTLKMTLNKGGTPNCSKLTILDTAPFSYGGSLVVSSVGGALTAGDSFTLFSASGGMTGSFTSITLPVLSGGLTWDTSALATTGTISITATGYLGWIAGFSGLSDTSAAGDPDQDGITNLMEYVLNGDPGQSSTSILPTQTPDASNFIFTFSRLADSATGTTQVFEYSTDLSTWTPLNITDPAASQVTISAATGGVQTVTVSIPRGANTELFGRLRVSN